jgi:hypothetical protein
LRHRLSRSTIARRRATALGILAIACALLFIAVRGGGDSSDSGGKRPAFTRPVVRAPAAHERTRPRVRHRIAAALKDGVGEAGRLGGAVEAAVMLGPWKTPAVAASSPADTSRMMRMWSMSKVLTFVALLREEGWGTKRGKPLTQEVSAALRAAITRSENCQERRVVLELQSVAGGAEAARKEMSEVLAEAGAQADISSESAPPESSCASYLEVQHEIDEPFGEALLVGISTWTVADAVRFAHALATDVYGRAVTRRVLGLMRVPKKRSHVVAPSEYTPSPNWGAGRALHGMNPAYKAGWGGVEQGEFMAGQIVVIDRPGDRAAMAVMFHPTVQPPLDDPGRTEAPHGLELVMKSVGKALG